jgi:hypothetical protein
MGNTTQEKQRHNGVFGQSTAREQAGNNTRLAASRVIVHGDHSDVGKALASHSVIVLCRYDMAIDSHSGYPSKQAHPPRSRQQEKTREYLRREGRTPSTPMNSTLIIQ